MPEIIKNNIPEVVDNTLITELAISEYIKKRLIRADINTLGELLAIDFNQLKKIRNLGRINIIELKNYIHSLGYTFINEDNYLSEIIEQKKKQGLKLLEDYGFSSRVYLTLYANDIYTLEDLIKFGPSVNQLKNFGPLRQQELLDRMQELGVYFKNDLNSEDLTSLISNDDEINKLQQENTEIRLRIENKERLIKAYENLLHQKEELLTYEKQLDYQIQQALVGLGNTQNREDDFENGRR